MFGYVRPFKPYLRMCEYDTYHGIYCGLCKTIGRVFGFVPRFTLSYDFTFLSLMDLSVNEVKMTAQRQRCIAHPLKKTVCVNCHRELDYSAYSAMLLIYHKIKDDLCDNEFSHKIRSCLLLPFFKRPYKKARMKYPGLAVVIEEQIKIQRQLEDKKCSKLDIACEPTAKIMEAVFGKLTNDDRKIDLQRFGYLLGRYIYMCDALDDVRDDYRKGNYNPLLVYFKIYNKSKELPKEDYNRIKVYVKDSVNITLGELAEVYVKLDLKKYKPIIDNVVYLGIRNVYELIEQDKFNRKKERKDDNERSV